MTEDDQKWVARFCVLRSAVMDLFADAETEITKYVIAHSAKPPGATQPMGQKISLAMKVTAGPQRSKALKARADIQLKVIQDLLTDRAAIVHSRMSIARCVSGKYVAIFKNSKDIAHNCGNALVFDESELTDFLDKLRKTTSELTTVLWTKNPPPSTAK